MMKLPRAPLRSFGPGLPLRAVSTRSISTIGLTPSKPHRALPSSIPFARRTYAVSASDLRFGQPVHETHPHILKAGELTPGITAQEYHDRRAALAHSMTDGSVAVLHAASLQYKSGAVFHAYRQESNFLYLTGWMEGDAIAVIEKTGPDYGDYVFHMFAKPKNAREEQWNGYRNGVEAARDIFNADEAHSIYEAEHLLPNILDKAKLIYADSPPSKGGIAATASWLWRLISGRDTRPTRTPLYSVMNKLRVVKSEAEVANMRIAGQISGRVITDAMRQPWKREKDLHWFLDYNFAVNGCEGPACHHDDSPIYDGRFNFHGHIGKFAT